MRFTKATARDHGWTQIFLSTRGRTHLSTPKIGGTKSTLSVLSFWAGEFWVDGDVRREDVKLLHFGGPGDELGACEEAWVVEGTNFDEDGAGAEFGAGGELDSAGGAEAAGGRAVAIHFVEGFGVAAGELEGLGGDGYEEVARPAGDFLADPAEA